MITSFPQTWTTTPRPLRIRELREKWPRSARQADQPHPLGVNYPDRSAAQASDHARETGLFITDRIALKSGYSVLRASQFLATTPTLLLIKIKEPARIVMDRETARAAAHAVP